MWQLFYKNNMVLTRTDIFLLLITAVGPFPIYLPFFCVSLPYRTFSLLVPLPYVSLPYALFPRVSPLFVPPLCFLPSPVSFPFISLSFVLFLCVFLPLCVFHYCNPLYISFHYVCLFSVCLPLLNMSLPHIYYFPFHCRASCVMYILL